MHNGCIADFHKIKRRLQNDLSDEMFSVPQGNTDSEWSFACFLDQLARVRQRSAIAERPARTKRLDLVDGCWTDNESESEDDPAFDAETSNARDSREAEGLHAGVRRG